MDNTAVFGTADVGSIPAGGTNIKNRAYTVFYVSSFGKEHAVFLPGVRM